MTFAQSQEEQIVGWMEVHEGIETEESSMEYSIDSSYSYSYNLPVYAGFQKTRDMLEKMGNPMPESIDQDQVESIVLSRYLYEDGEDQYLKKEYTSQEDIQKNGLIYLIIVDSLLIKPFSFIVYLLLLFSLYGA